MGIKTPLLQLFINYYGNIGIHLRPVNTKNWHSILLLLMTLLFDIIVFYGFIVIDNHADKNVRLPGYRCKTAYDLMAQISAKYTCRIVFALNSLYLFMNGHRIISLMDAELFQRVFKPLNAWAILIAVATLSHMHWLLVYFELIKRNAVHFSYEHWIQILSMYLINIHQYLPWTIIQYCKYATYQLLQDDLKKLKTNLWQIESEVVHEIQTLAHLNKELNHLISFLLVTFFLANTIDLIVTIFSLIRYGAHPSGIGGIIFFSIYLGYNIYLNMNIKSLVKNEFKNLPQLLTEPNSGYLARLGFKKKKQICLPTYRSKSNQYKLEGIELYSRYFRLSMFQICPVDLAFLLNLAVFILGYVVISLQTND